VCDHVQMGSAAPCSDEDDISCAGVPWANTPFVGASGQCSASGTVWGGWGADASRTPWRIAMDYVLYPKESIKVRMFTESGVNSNTDFGSQSYLNRIARQYHEHAECDGGVGDCGTAGNMKTYQIQPAFANDFVTCDNVPNTGDGWWSAFMSYPTFTAFVAPYAGITENENVGWMETFSSICTFSDGLPSGDVCSSSYFEAGQEVISTMIMSGSVVSLNPLPPSPPPSPQPTPQPMPMPAPVPSPSDCPGGSLSACLDICPHDPTSVYQACVQTCLARCSAELQI